MVTRESVFSIHSRVRRLLPCDSLTCSRNPARSIPTAARGTARRPMSRLRGGVCEFIIRSDDGISCPEHRVNPHTCVKVAYVLCVRTPNFLGNAVCGRAFNSKIVSARNFYSRRLSVTYLYIITVLRPTKRNPTHQKTGIAHLSTLPTFSSSDPELQGYTVVQTRYVSNPGYHKRPSQQVYHR